MLNTVMENEDTSFVNISSPFLISMLWTWSQGRDRNISKTCVFIFHHIIQHDEASGYINIFKLIHLLLIYLNLFKSNRVWKYKLGISFVS